MKANVIRKTWLKILMAVILSVTLTTSVFIGGACIWMTNLGYYAMPFEEVLNEELSCIAADYGYDFPEKFGVEGEMPEFDKEFTTDVEDKDVDYVIKNEKGKVLYSSYDKKEDYLAHNTVETSFYGGDDTILKITTYIKSNYMDRDMMKLHSYLYKAKVRLIVEAIVLFLISIVLYIILMFGAGRRTEDDEIHLRRIDHIPADLYLLIAATSIIGLIALGGALIWDTRENLYEFAVGSVAAAYVFGIICVLIFTGFSTTIAVQTKKKMFLGNTVIGRIIKVIGTGIKALPYTWKVVGIAAVLAIANFICAGCSYNEEVTFVLVCEWIVIVAAVWYLAIMLNRIKKGGKKIAEGNLDSRIDTNKMLPELKGHADNLNNINDAINKAVNERMRSEMFKTELITNVSHDIKTPLTSIINYTDLLMAEDLENETAREYVATISKHAEKLNKLTRDIVDASKASTGNVKINLEKCSIGMMIEQVFGEYREKMEAAELTPVMKLPEEDLLVMADGQHMGRILDNIFGNIIKYAQRGTRVYLDLRRENDKAVMEFKNISGAELNISADDLMERFVRGDSSRNTEGSGLGLSIAKSLTRLQGGELNISIDGDLFKVIVVMNIAS